MWIQTYSNMRYHNNTLVVVVQKVACSIKIENLSCLLYSEVIDSYLIMEQPQNSRMGDHTIAYIINLFMKLYLRLKMEFN